MANVSSWISSKTQKSLPSKIAGLGFFAKEDINKGEIVAIKGGHVIDRQTLLEKENVIKDSQVQLTDELYLAPIEPQELTLSMIYFNHSCEPNIGIQGQIVLVAMSDIKSGEELTLDYATCFNDDITNFSCNCGAGDCRKQITGHDWQRPELQYKYKGYFAWFLERKINR